MRFMLESIFLLYVSAKINGSIDAITIAKYFCFAYIFICLEINITLKYLLRNRQEQNRDLLERESSQA